MLVVKNVVIDLLIATGAIFLLLGSIGVVRFPDVYNRLHASTKTPTIGATSVLLAAALKFGPFSSGFKALICIIILFFATPVGAHMISRAADRYGVEFYRKKAEKKIEKNTKVQKKPP